MKKKQGNSEAAAPKRRSFLVLRITAWVAAGALLGLSHAFGHTLAGAYLAAAFALSIALLYRLLPSRQWWELYLAGYAAHAVCCHWLAQIIQVYSAMPLPLAILCAGLLFVFPALQFVVFDLVHRGLCGKFLIRHSLALPLAWLAVEALFPKLIPWYLGQAESKFLILAQAADIAGPALISFLLFWWAALLVDGCAALAGNNASGAVRKAVLLALAFSLTFVYGRYRLYSLDKALAQSNPLRLALVQGNLDPFHDYFDGKMEDRLAKLRGISRDFLAQHDPDILVWPESSAGYDYYPEHLGARLTQEQDPYPELHVPLVFGGQLRAHTQHADQPHYYNSAFLRMPDASLAGAYRKQEHFPFSERVPLSNYFPALEKLRNRDYVLLRGEDEKPFSLTVRRISNNRPIRIATAICFEDMWPNVFLAQFKRGGADLLLALSNDGWFLDSVAAPGHYFSSVWRAIELRRTLVRATNNGITAIVDPLGREHHVLTPRTAGVLYADDVRILEFDSPYSRYGHRLVSIAAGLIIILAATRLLLSIRVLR